MQPKRHRVFKALCLSSPPGEASLGGTPETQLSPPATSPRERSRNQGLGHGGRKPQTQAGGRSEFSGHSGGPPRGLGGRGELEQQWAGEAG